MEGAATAKGEGFLSRMALNDNKAGMEGLDRDKINTIDHHGGIQGKYKPCLPLYNASGVCACCLLCDLIPFLCSLIKSFFHRVDVILSFTGV